MKKVLLAAILLVAFSFGYSAFKEQDTRVTAEAHHQDTQRRSARGEGTQRLRPGCNKHYRMKVFYRYTKQRYSRRSAPLTRGQKTRIHHLARCLANEKKTRWAFNKKRKWRSQFRARLAYYRLTPYGPCFGGRWAVPCEIIDGESDGSWSAVNGNGCVGPYQFCGWSVPWPVNSWEDKLAHHRQARYLWAGGSGCSNWQQTSSQC